MAKDIQSGPDQSQISAAQHLTPPTARDLRAHAVHRLQIGLFGLATMLLIVALANIVMDRARKVDTASGITASGTPSGTTSSDPLADIGVLPASDPSAAPPPAR